jgi:hypothetical protein
MPQPEREVRELRNDLRSVCAVERAQAAEVLLLLEALVKGQGQAHEDSEQLHADLTPKGGLPTALSSQAQPVQVSAPEGGLPVSSPDETAELSAAVLQDSETQNSNVWAIAGLLTGFGFLWVLRKVALP